MVNRRGMSTKCIQAYIHSQNASFASTVREISSISSSTALFYILSRCKKEKHDIKFCIKESGAQHAKIPHPVLNIYLTFSISIKNLIPKLSTVIVNQTVILKTTMFSNCLLSVLLFYETKNLSWSFGLNFALFNGVQNEYLEMLLLIIIHY